MKTIDKFFVSLAVLSLMALVTRYNHSRERWPNLKAQIGNRSGTVVSHWPFDVWVTINTARLTPPDYPPGDPRWYYAPSREWIGDWRWNVRFYLEEE